MLQFNTAKNKKLTFVLLLGYFLIHIIFTKILTHALNLPMRVSVTVQLVSYIVLGTAGIFLYWEKIVEGAKLWKEHPLKNALFLIGAFIADIVLSNLAFLPMSFVDPDYVSLNEHSVVELQGKFPAILLIFALGVMGPVTEEVVFRIVPNYISDKKGTKIAAVMIAAVAFMLMHIQDLTPEELLYNLPMLVTGMIFGTVLLLTKNPTIPLILHIMNNLPAMAILMLKK